MSEKENCVVSVDPNNQNAQVCENTPPPVMPLSTLILIVSAIGLGVVAVSSGVMLVKSPDASKALNTKLGGLYKILLQLLSSIWKKKEKKVPQLIVGNTDHGIYLEEYTLRNLWDSLCRLERDRNNLFAAMQFLETRVKTNAHIHKFPLEGLIKEIRALRSFNSPLSYELHVAVGVFDSCVKSAEKALKSDLEDAFNSFQTVAPPVIEEQPTDKLVADSSSSRKKDKLDVVSEHIETDDDMPF